MRGRLASATFACVMALAVSGYASTQTPVQPPELAVCLVLSPKLAISVRAAAVVLGESNARYRERGVLSVATSAYTLNAVERARLFVRMPGEPRRATRE